MLLQKCTQSDTFRVVIHKSSTTMKAILLTPFLLLFWSTAIGQTLDQPGTPEERARKITQEMITHLHLDSLQTDTVHALNLTYARIAQRDILDPHLSKLSMLRKGKKLNQQKEADLKPLLTDDQWADYLKLKAQRQRGLINQLFE